jgi:putative methyltransferase (TIGR04325 family)
MGQNGPDHSIHNTFMTFGYVAALAALRGDRSVSILDWGGGLGHYWLLARALLPGVETEYHCKDLPATCDVGRRLAPEIIWYETDAECFAKPYDLVIASSSLQYAQDWRQTASLLAGSTRNLLYITQLPVVRFAPSFVVVQRPYRYGYNTEYFTWILNRAEFLDHMATLDVRLVREFLVEASLSVAGAPERAEYSGYLFSKLAS